MSQQQAVVRNASHAGSWYSSRQSELSSQLDGWLNAVPPSIKCIGPESSGQTVDTIPQPNARVIIAPHAGYAYSGPAAAWAYKSWDVAKAKRVFLLGPSHHFYLTKAALSQCTHYATPLGNLAVDRETTAELHKSGQFQWMSQDVDEDEHSLEMHLPYVHKVLSNSFSKDAMPTLVPIMIGNTSSGTERALGQLLAPYLKDPSNAFVISSDFAHWGLRFHYTYYRSPSSGPTNLKSSSKPPKDSEIHESIKEIDFECMSACESGSHEAWLAKLEETGNTVCGRHPIGVVMAAIEELQKGGGESARFKFVKYERSSEVRKVSESSVSYASAFCVI